MLRFFRWYSQASVPQRCVAVLFSSPSLLTFSLEKPRSGAAGQRSVPPSGPGARPASKPVQRAGLTQHESSRSPKNPPLREARKAKESTEAEDSKAQSDSVAASPSLPHSSSLLDSSLCPL